MSKVTKTLERVLRGTSDANIGFIDLGALLSHLGFAERVRGSHRIFTRDGVADQHCGKDAAMFEQALMLVPVGVAVGLAAHSVCRADGRGSSPGRMAHRWTWPAVAVTFLGVIALGPRGFASAAASVACLIGLPLAVAEAWQRVRGLFDQPSAQAHSSWNRVGNAPRGPLGTRLNEVDGGPSPHEFVEQCSEISDDGSEDELVSLLDESVTQWLKRSRPSPGEERIDGMTRAEFAPGEKQVAVHVAFCPPLSAVPVVTCELLDDADVRLRVTTIQTYGVRMEAKRSNAVGETLAVAVRFSASAGAVSAPRESARSAA